MTKLLNIFLLLIVSVFSYNSNKKISELLTKRSAPIGHYPSREEISDLISIKESSNGIIEDSFKSLLTTYHKLSSKIPLLDKISTVGISEECKAKGYTGPNLLMFFPSLIGKLTVEEKQIEFKNSCFRKNTLSLKFSEDKTEADIIIDSSDPSSLFCLDYYLIHTSDRFHVTYSVIHGRHITTFRNLTEDDLTEIRVSGIRVFTLCESLTDTMEALYKTIEFYLDSKKSNGKINFTDYPYFDNKSLEEIEYEHMIVIRDYGEFEVEKRENGLTPVPIEEYIQSGDYLSMAQISSYFSPLTMVVTGNAAEHSGVAVRVPPNNELYILEMRGDGMSILSYEEFLKFRIRINSTVTHIPLKDEYRKRFNSTKALEYFYSKYPKRYGMFAMVYAWWDTLTENLPDYINTEVIMPMMALLDKIYFKYSYLAFGGGINRRLDNPVTVRMNTHETVVLGAKRGVTYEQLGIMPERDDYIYENGDNIVCSSFAIHVYKESGVLNDFDFHANEFTPGDIVYLSIFKDKWDVPEVCQKNDPGLGYCQILGNYRMKLRKIGTVQPYDHMFEKCPSKAPKYGLRPGC